MEHQRKVLVDSARRVEIRRAREEDIPWVETELVEFSQSIGTKHSLFPPSAEALRGSLQFFMRDHLFLVAERGTQRLGFIVGFVTPHPFNHKLQVLTEVLWWVPPRHRGCRAGVMLLDAFVDWGKDNAEWVYFAIHRTTPMSDRALVRRGFREEQRQYLLEADRNGD